MFLKLPKTRKFTYRPIYYQPPREDEEGPRIKFRRYGTSKTPKKRPLLVMVVLVIILIFLLSHWLKIETSSRNDFKFKDFKIEEIK